MGVKMKEHALKEIDGLFVLDPDSPSGLVWGKKSSKQGTVAGAPKIEKTGKITAWRVNHSHKFYYVHRVIWYLLVGEDPGKNVIDHIDGNPLNNAYTNLRSIPKGLNSRNKMMNPANTTGVTGVTYRERFQCGKLYRYFVATWMEDSKYGSKSFNADVLGDDIALNQATNYRMEMITKLNAKGVGYTDRHGM